MSKSQFTEALRPPITADPAVMRQWGFTLINQLRKILEEDLGSAQNALNDIRAVTGNTLTNFDDLSDAEKASLGLSEAVNDALAINDVIADLQNYIDNAGKAAIYARLRDHQNEAAIRVEQTTRETESTSFTSQLTTLTADIASANAAIAAEITARTDGDTAIASDVTTLQTTVAGNTSSITTNTTSINGVEAQWGITIDSNNQVVGMIRLDGGQSESAFTAVVDKFTIAKLDGSDPIAVFQVGTVGGATKIALAGDMLVDGSIVAQAIAANAITADKINASAVTADKINSNAVTADKINANAVTTAKIAAGAVTADEIGANAVTAAKINVTSLDALAVDAGTITAGKLQRSDGAMVVDLDNKTITIFTLGDAETIIGHASVSYTGGAVTVTIA